MLGRVHRTVCHEYNARERATPSGMTMEPRYATWRRNYCCIMTNQEKSIWTGNLTVVFAPYMAGEDVKFHTLEFEIHKTEEYIARTALQRCLSQGSPTMNKSPKMSRTPGKNKAQKMQQEPLTMESFPSAPVNEFGVTSAVMQFFEVMQGTNMLLKNHGD